MAPELVLEEGARHSYASDIWAFGCLTIEVREGTVQVSPPKMILISRGSEQVQSGQVPYQSKSNYPQVVAALAEM